MDLYLLVLFPRKGLPNELYRGYVLLNKEGEVERSIVPCENKLKIYIMFADVRGMHLQIGKKLLNIPLFDDVVSR